MVKEIERKFLMNLNHWPKNEKGLLYEQGYLAITKKGIARVRIKEDKSTLTIKSKGTGLSRDEFEYQIPTEDAKKLLHLCKNDIISKTRYKVMSNNKIWDVDEFHGKNNACHGDNEVAKAAFQFASVYVFPDTYPCKNAQDRNACELQ